MAECQRLLLRTRAFCEVLAIMPDNIEKSAFRSRMQEIIGSESLRSFAQRCGLSEGAVRNYLSGGEPTRPALWAISDAAGVALEWLATGRGPKEPPQDVPPGLHRPVLFDSPEDLGDDYLLIPLYDQAASAGAGALALDLEQDGDGARPSSETRLAFLKAWLRGYKGLHPSKLFLLTVAGDSMEPTLSQGDVVLVDRSTKRVTNDGLYIVRLDGSLLVKRVQALPGGVLEITSDNPVYKPFTLRLEDEGRDVAIIGRVMWVGKEM